MNQATDIFLQPGEYFVGDADYTLRTLLGSCVSITLWHPTRRVGAMSHFLLPSRGTPHTTTPDGRYGDEAMKLMLRELARFDVAPQECVGKVFGGAHMFPGHMTATSMQIGMRNGAAARTLLRAHRIRIASESLYGNEHRNIIFKVGSGDVWLRR